MTDEEGAVSNASNLLDPDIEHVPCLCHVLQTIVKHGTGLPDKLYKRDPFAEGNKYFLHLMHFNNPKSMSSPHLVV